MEISRRKPFQGVLNIIRFNWHYYVLAALSIACIFVIKHYYSPLNSIGNLVALLIVCSITISLAVSFYIYDVSDLYKFLWLRPLESDKTERIINVNAGFDETSTLLKSRFANCELIVVDFYDPAKHTEVSIKRVRKAFPVLEAQQIRTDQLPIEDGSADKVFAILSAHEIRNDEERIVFFKELHRVLKPTGKIIVTEHLRDAANFIAYNIGFFHFHSKATWINTFQSAGLHLSKEIKITPFITSFILEKNGIAS